MKYLIYLFFGFAISGFPLNGCTTQDVMSEPSANSSTIDPSLGRDAWRVNNYHKAVDFYMSLDLHDQPDLLFERGRLLLEIAEFYTALNEFAVPVKTHLLSVWRSRDENGEMDSPSLNCQLAIDAYALGDYSRAASYREVLGESADVEVIRLAQAAVALGMLQSGQGHKAQVLIDSLTRIAENAPSLALRLQRYLGEIGEIELAKKIYISPTAKQTMATGISNAVIVDQAWKIFQVGDVRSAWRLLKTYRPEVPIWQEDLNVEGDIGSNRTRKIFSLDFIPLMSRIYFKLAREDMVRVTSEESEMGLQALYYAGVADYRAGDIERGLEELSTFVDKTIRTEDPYLEYLGTHSRIIIAVELRKRGKESQAEELRYLLPVDDSYRHWAIEALDRYENFHHVGVGADSISLRSLSNKLDSVRYNSLSGADRYYFYEAALKTSLVLIRGSDVQVELARMLLEKIYDKTSAYKVDLEKPALLLRLAQVYYKYTKVDWGLSKNIVELMGQTFPECVPVAYMFAYLQSAAKLDPGGVTQGAQ
jgi:hypothetical protein